MTVTVLSEAVHPMAPIVSEAPVMGSRDSVAILQSQTILVGQVLGRTINQAGLVSPATAIVLAPGSTANGTIVMDAVAPIGLTAIDGVYTVEMNTAGATAEFALMDPTGKVVGEGVVGTTYNSQLKFLITTGGVAFAVGDRISITVAIPIAAQLWEALNLLATDGSQVARGVAMYPAVTAAGQNLNITAITRNAEVRGSDLVWPAGATAAQIAEGTAQLQALGISVR